LPEALVAELSARANSEVADAVDFARLAPPPPVARAFEDVY
jgi:TPP-dependent pyruvate/acetoin dehydrogenase alpha subunit